MVAGALGYMARAADGGRAAELVTRDFLGGCVAADDARDAAAAATARHDSVSGKLSLQKQTCPATPRDLNLFPVPGAAASAAKPCPSSTAEAAASGAGGTTTTTTYHSVCTIEKVKTALERFERGKHHQHQQQHSAGASPSSSSVTTSSVKRRGGGGGGSGGDGAVEQGDGCDSPSAAGGMVAAACPRCFLYVLISRSDPRCPRCESHVPPPPSPAPKKKPRIDLNVGFLGT